MGESEYGGAAAVAPLERRGRWKDRQDYGKGENASTR